MAVLAFRRKMSRIPTVSLLFAAFAVGGCTFSRAVVNPHHDRHDTSWIVPGKTTRDEVVKRLGMPPSVINGRGGVKEGSLRYLTRDAFTARIETGYIVTPTFEVCRERHQHDLLIKFGDKEVVSFVSRTMSVNGENRIVEFKESP